MTDWAEAYPGGWWSCQLADGEWLFVSVTRLDGSTWNFTHERWDRSWRRYVVLTRGADESSAADARRAADTYVLELNREPGPS
jgi:hypothetical protein